MTTKSVPASATAVTLIESVGSGRRTASVYYDGAAILYLLAGPGTATSTNFTVKMGEGLFTYWEAPAGFSDSVTGIWSSAVGSALVTRFG
jgi:hypothetical protein